MSAMRKFAVLESSLLARKGQAQPAYPQHAHEANAVTRVDDYVMAVPRPETHGHDPESTLASLINRPVLRVPTGTAEPRAEPVPVVLAAVVEAEVAPAEPAFAEPTLFEHASIEPAFVELGFLDPRDDVADAAAAPAEPAPAFEPAVAKAPAGEDEGRSLREVVTAWTRRVAKDRRAAASLHPRGLSREQAAAYVGLSVSTFNKLVAAGVLPQALAFGRRRVWDRRTLDKALDGMSGIDPAALAAVPHDA
jgi:predicted DNA-binding transcriptional regulator AlpA